MSAERLQRQLELIHRKSPDVAAALRGLSPQPSSETSPPLDPAALLQFIESCWAKGHQLIAVTGVSDGQWLQRYISHPPHPRGQQMAVVVVEPDAAHWLDILCRYDLAPLFSIENLFWCIGSNWEQQWRRLDETKHLSGSFNPTSISPCRENIVPRGRVYREVEDRLRTLIGAYSQSLNQAFAALPQQLLASRGTIQRVWVLTLEVSYATTYVLRGLIQGMRALGLEVAEYHVPAHDYRSPGSALYSLIESKPDLILTANQPLRQNLGPAVDTLPIPQVVWFTDVPLFELADPKLSNRNLVCCFDSHYIPAFSRKIGRPVGHLRGAAYQPEAMAMDPALRCQVSVVGSVQSVDGLVARFSPVDRDYLRQLAEAKVSDRTLDLEAAIQAQPPAGPLQQVGTAQVAGLIYTLANSIYRRRGVEQLLQFDLSIWGRESWLEGEPDHSPLRKAYRGFIRDPRQLAALYQSSDIHVSLHSVGAIGGLNMHCWNALAHRGFILTENLPGIAESFIPESEIACFPFLAALPDVVDDWLANPSRRKEVADAGYSRVLRDHTFANRTRELLAIVKQQWRTDNFVVAGIQ